MPPEGFEPAIPGWERSQTHALDRAATEIGLHISSEFKTHSMLGAVISREFLTQF
jgi:hypothetical protein